VRESTADDHEFIRSRRDITVPNDELPFPTVEHAARHGLNYFRGYRLVATKLDLIYQLCTIDH
jgi:hypothetical protein